MRILAIHGFLDKLRGAELTFTNMMISLKKRGHDVEIIVLGISDYHKNRLEANGIRIRNIEFKEFYLSKPLSFLNSYFRLLNLLRAALIYRSHLRGNKGFDVLFAHHYNYAPLSLLFAEMPKVYYCQEPPRGFYEPTDDTRSMILRLLSALKNFLPRTIEKGLDRYCVKHADLVLCNSNYSREYIWRSYGIYPITNYLGVDSEKFKPLNIEKQNLVLAVGAIHPKKAHDFVVRSIGLIAKEKRPNLVIVGSGTNEDKKELMDLAKEKEVSLEIKSNIQTEEVVELYNKAKVAAIAYIREPSIEPEALACGTPVVAVNEGGVPEAINSEVGVLTRRDEGEFAKAVLYLLDNPQIAEQMGRQGIELVKKSYNWETCAENLENNFRKAITLREKRR